MNFSDHNLLGIIKAMTVLPYLRSPSRNHHSISISPVLMPKSGALSCHLGVSASLDICHLWRLSVIIMVVGPNDTTQFQLYDSSCGKECNFFECINFNLPIFIMICIFFTSLSHSYQYYREDIADGCIYPNLREAMLVLRHIFKLGLPRRAHFSFN